MTLSKYPRSFLLLLSAVLTAQTQEVTANFFSRTIGFARDGEDAVAQPTADKQPTGVVAATGSEAQVGSVISYEKGVLSASLANNHKIPLVGVGVGNVRAEYIGSLVSNAIQDDKKIRLIDTAHTSLNENLIAEGLVHGVEFMGLAGGDKLEVHLVTKVWYTHLGYERTKAAVQEIMEALAPALVHEKIDLRLHLLLHWPRCYDTVPWMECAKEEASLPQHIRNLGPDPNEDPDNAWKESWKSLEDLYLSDKYPIASIGVSNFHLHDLETMDSFARIHPHVLQVNIWSLLYDSMLVDYCHKNRIHLQAYNAMNGTLLKATKAPRAYRHILKTANELGAISGNTVTPGQAILAWLVQHGVSVVPRTSRLARLSENSATSLAAIPAMTDAQVETIAHSVEAYLSGDDLEQDIHVSVTFHVVTKDIMLYWRDKRGNEVRIAYLQQGETFNETTYPNHTFRTYDASNKDYWIDHQIEANYGEHKDIHVEL